MNFIDTYAVNKNGMNIVGTETSPVFNKKGGGLFGDDDNSQKALKAAIEKEYAALSFLIRNGMVSDYTQQDPLTGQTILHYVARNYQKIPNSDEVINKILADSSVGSFINIQDKNNDTPLHIALESGNQPLVNAFIRAGADPKIKGNLGRYIVEDNAADQSSVFVAKQPLMEGSETDIRNVINKLIAIDRAPESDYSAAMPKTLNTEIFQTDKFLDELSKPKEYTIKINSLPSNLSNLTGGKLINGSRRLNAYSEYENMFGGDSDDDDDNCSKKSKSKSKKHKTKYNKAATDSEIEQDMRGLSRQAHSQVDTIHERTVNTIIKILNLDPTNEADKKKARIYKGVLYRRVKTEQPDLKGYDRAIEMEKLATRENLDNIDIDQVTAQIEEQHKNKPAESGNKKKTTKPRKPRKKTPDTSSVSPPDVAGLSPTSIDA